MTEKKTDFSKNYNNYLAPEAMIWINGKKLSEQWIYFTSLEVEKYLDGADTFSFSVSDAIDLEFKPKNANLFELGDTVEIHIGYADSHKEKSDLSMLFIGLITSVNWNFSEDNYLDISVEGKDYSFLLMKHTYNKIIKEATISDIVEKIMNETYKNTFKKVKIEATDVTYKQVKNQEENDYLFIKSLADKIGYEFFIDNKNFYFQSQPQNQSSAFTLYYGKEILGFKPEMNVEKEISKVKVIGLELSGDKERIVGEATLQSSEGIFTDASSGIKSLLKKLNAIEYEVKEPVKTLEEATKRAKSILENFSKNFFKGEIKSIGIPDLKPGITITLSGLGKRFSRDYYVEKTVHSFSEQGYETTVSVRGSRSSFKKLVKGS